MPLEFQWVFSQLFSRPEIFQNTKLRGKKPLLGMLSYNFAFDLRCQSQISFSWIETPFNFFFSRELSGMHLKNAGAGGVGEGRGGHTETPKLVLQTFDFS